MSVPSFYFKTIHQARQSQASPLKPSTKFIPRSTLKPYHLLHFKKSSVKFTAYSIKHEKWSYMNKASTAYEQSTEKALINLTKDLKKIK